MLDVIQTTDGVSAIRVMIQLTTLIMAAFGGGVVLGRFLYSRSIEIKNAELSVQQARFDSLTDRLQELKDNIASAENLEKAKSVAKKTTVPLVKTQPSLFDAVMRDTMIAATAGQSERAEILRRTLTPNSDK